MCQFHQHCTCLSVSTPAHPSSRQFIDPYKIRFCTSSPDLTPAHQSPYQSISPPPQHSSPSPQHIKPYKTSSSDSTSVCQIIKSFIRSSSFPSVHRIYTTVQQPLQHQLLTLHISKSVHQFLQQFIKPLISPSDFHQYLHQIFHPLIISPNTDSPTRIPQQQFTSCASSNCLAPVSSVSTPAHQSSH